MNKQIPRVYYNNLFYHLSRFRQNGIILLGQSPRYIELERLINEDFETLQPKRLVFNSRNLQIKINGKTVDSSSIRENHHGGNKHQLKFSPFDSAFSPFKIQTEFKMGRKSIQKLDGRLVNRRSTNNDYRKGFKGTIATN